jgi:hypothetical protein
MSNAERVGEGRNRTVYVATWYDLEDKGWPRVAGIYSTEKLAEKRLEEVGSGAIQRLRLDEPVRFTWEEDRR